MDFDQSNARAILNTILRVPAWFILEAMLRDGHVLYGYSSLSTLAWFGAYFVSLVLLGSSIKTLLRLYQLIAAFGLLLCSGLLSRVYLTADLDNFSLAAALKWTSVSDIKNATEVNYTWLAVHVGLQCIINSLISYLLKLTHAQRFLLMAYCLPIIASTIGVAATELLTGYVFVNRFVLILALIYALSKASFMYGLIKMDLIFWASSWRVLGVLTTLITCWKQFKMSAQLSIFWFLLYLRCLAKQFLISPETSESRYMTAFSCLGEACSTQLSIIACCFTVSYLSKMLIAVIRKVVIGDGTGAHEEVAASGNAEGIMMFIISMQIDLLELKPLERAFTLSVIVCLIVTTLIQSIYEITEPHLLSLSAVVTRNNIWSHIKAVSLCVFLICLPVVMCYYIGRMFNLGAVSLIIMASFAVTSFQVVGALMVYGLFVFDSFQETSWQGLDDAVYYIRATTRVIDFLVAVIVVAFGLYETAFGERNWVNLICLLLHLYFGIWVRLQEGWKSFLLRRSAVEKVQSLSKATAEQLEEVDDVCAICHQEMLSAKITHCKHFFHDVCLRKWLYVQDSCPLCHQSITPPEVGPEEIRSFHSDQTNEVPPADFTGESLHEASQKLEEAIGNLRAAIHELEEAKKKRQQIEGAASDPGGQGSALTSFDTETRTKLRKYAQTLNEMARDTVTVEESFSSPSVAASTGDAPSETGSMDCAGQSSDISCD